MENRFEIQAEYEKVFARTLTNIQNDIRRVNKEIDDLTAELQYLSNASANIGEIIERKINNHNNGAFKEADLEFEELAENYRQLVYMQSEKIDERKRLEERLKHLHLELKERMAAVKEQNRSVIDGHKEVSDRLADARQESEHIAFKEWNGEASLLDEARKADLDSEIIPFLSSEEGNYYENQGYNIHRDDENGSRAL